MRSAVIVVWMAAVGLSLWLTAPAAAQDEDGSSEAATSPKLAFVGQEQPALSIVDEDDVAVVTLAVANSGTDAENVKAGLLFDGEAPILACAATVLDDSSAPAASPCGDDVEGRDSATFSVPANQVVRVEASFDTDGRRLPAEPLVQVSADGALPALATLELRRTLSEPWLWVPIVVAVVAGIVCLFLIATGFEHKDTSLIYTESSWTFGGSWATSVTALAGLLGTVLAATGFLSDILPGVSTGRFSGFVLLFTGAALLSPIVYSALGAAVTAEDQEKLKLPPSVGTRTGLLLSSALTIGAASGQLKHPGSGDCSFR